MLNMGFVLGFKIQTRSPIYVDIILEPLWNSRFKYRLIQYRLNTSRATILKHPYASFQRQGNHSLKILHVCRLEHDDVACPIAVKLLTEIPAQLQMCWHSSRLSSLSDWLLCTTSCCQPGTPSRAPQGLQGGHTHHPCTQLAQPQPPDCKCHRSLPWLAFNCRHFHSFYLKLPSKSGEMSPFHSHRLDGK